MTDIATYAHDARHFIVAVNGAYAARINNEPVRGHVGSNGRKGAWIIRALPAAPASVAALDGARFLRMNEAEAAIQAKLK